MSIDLIKKLRDETQASIKDIKAAVDESGGDYSKALQIIKSRGLARAEKKASRSTNAGIVEAYIHGDARVGVLVELQCETDFVAKNELFKELAHHIAMQVAAMSPDNLDELLEQPFIKDQAITVNELIQKKISTLGENIKLERFTRYEI